MTKKKPVASNRHGRSLARKMAPDILWAKKPIQPWKFDPQQAVENAVSGWRP